MVQVHLMYCHIHAAVLVDSLADMRDAVVLVDKQQLNRVEVELHRDHHDNWNMHCNHWKKRDLGLLKDREKCSANRDGGF